MQETSQKPNQTILFFHGWLHSGEIWIPVIKYLGDQFTILNPDLPGFGDAAPLPAKDRTIDGLAKWAADYIRGFSTNNPPIVIADSLSAIVMLEVLRVHELELKKLILLGCPADGLPWGIRLMRKGLPVGQLIRSLQKLPDKTLTRLIRHGNVVTMYKRDVNIEPLIRGLKSTHAGSAVSYLDRIFMPYPYLPDLNIPVTVLRGEYDRIVTKRSSVDLASRLHADYVEISGSGHTVMLEQPEKLVHIIKQQIQT